MKVLVIHGPNLQLLGKREPEVYGSKTLKQIDDEIRKHAKTLGVTVTTFHSNHEGDIVDKIGAAIGQFDALVINPGAFTHTSVAIRDAISGAGISAVEVHLSNVHAREEFRRHSYIAPVCKGSICGFGSMSYILAIEALAGK
ncbi:MAG: type II 3-dehydroquinate dehydratase [Candidatus Lindowbacteria bacterium]|nr:type II 3-dehydroquinate dehydratase [Candidatus Lindowbacteria bacterium]